MMRIWKIKISMNIEMNYLVNISVIQKLFNFELFHLDDFFQADTEPCGILKKWGIRHVNIDINRDKIGSEYVNRPRAW